MIVIPEAFLPYLSVIVLFAAATIFGMQPIHKIIEMREARHELKQGSAGWIRSLSGWSFVAFWIVGTGAFAGFLADWAQKGDLSMAIAQSGNPLNILSDIAATIAGD